MCLLDGLNCSVIGKGAVAAAFLIAYKVNANSEDCKPFTDEEWQKVGYDSNETLKHKLVCVPAKWSAVMQ